MSNKAGNFMKLEEINFEAFKTLTDVVNESILGIINSINPRDHADNLEFFISIALSAPAMIAASIIEHIKVTFDLSTQELVDSFVEKTKLALAWKLPYSKFIEAERKLDERC